MNTLKFNSGGEWLNHLLTATKTDKQDEEFCLYVCATLGIKTAHVTSGLVYLYPNSPPKSLRQFSAWASERVDGAL